MNFTFHVLRFLLLKILIQLLLLHRLKLSLFPDIYETAAIEYNRVDTLV